MSSLEGVKVKVAEGVGTCPPSDVRIGAVRELMYELEFIIMEAASRSRKHACVDGSRLHSNSLDPGDLNEVLLEVG